MELPKIGLSDGGVLDGIKSKLGIGAKKDDSRDSYDGYDSYDSYDDHGDDAYDDYDSYDSYGDYETTNPNRKVYNEYRSHDNRATASEGVTRPRLVSIDDVRANTQLDIDARSYRDAKSADVRSSYDFAASSRELRSEGLNSLFSPTTDAFAHEPDSSVSAERPAAVSPLSEQPTLRPAGMSYEAFSAVSARQTPIPSRLLDIMRPRVYSDIEHMAKTVRNGNVALLVLTATPEALSKRLLDFSFGVASAFGARVDCIGNKVFAICIGDALSAEEMQNLKEQGVL